MSDLKPASSPETGELLDGRYLLDEKVGVGGMGIVYRARDESLGRTVAVKIFRESAADAARSTSETRLLASLNHPSLVTLFDAQTASDRPNYLVMEYVDGPTLRQRLAEAPLRPDDVAAMARDLADALHIVHQAGIVHRDIKPSNVLLRPSHVPGEEFRAKLADFGIAYLIDSTRLTTPGTLVGTAAYLSPEQVRGVEPAPASDIYALGLVLLEALTGERAFPQTGTHEAALARLSRDPVVPGEFGYPWRSLLAAMTARDPGERPSALDVLVAARALDRADPAPDTGAITAVGEMAAEDALSAVTATLIMTQPGATGAETAVLPADTTEYGAETAVLPAETVGGTATTGEPSRRTGRSAAAAGEPLRRRRVQLIAIVVALIVLATIVGILIWALRASSPAPAPQLPQVTEPLGTHLQQLLDSVTR
ncbi:serine/threonine-protein kinase [Herbiconiux sp.]|uniref:serine/threonine-protein kinase n=1 Tax=Herbiconiux sp. TaxID=1871186 RepID=UPI0025C4BC63|nr:serine/threonine-protein kinase [Herbiconiux sp.]